MLILSRFKICETDTGAVYFMVPLQNFGKEKINISWNPLISLLRGPNGDVGIEGNSGSDGKSEWSEMMQARVDEG